MKCKCEEKHDLYYVKKAKHVKCSNCERFVDSDREKAFIEYEKTKQT